MWKNIAELFTDKLVFRDYNIVQVNEFTTCAEIYTKERGV